MNITKKLILIGTLALSSSAFASDDLSEAEFRYFFNVPTRGQKIDRIYDAIVQAQNAEMTSNRNALIVAIVAYFNTLSPAEKQEFLEGMKK